jgi:putative ABC transport system ATP-binding protein
LELHIPSVTLQTDMAGTPARAVNGDGVIRFAPPSVAADLKEMPLLGRGMSPTDQIACIPQLHPMLQVCDLRTAILKPSSLSLSAGECVAVQGPSGAGKTLLLRAIADLDPNQGAVTLDDRDRSTIAAPLWRRLVGYVPAEPGWWTETVGEHFLDWQAAFPCLQKLGFSEETRNSPIMRMSTGERLRLALVRALTMRPKVLLLDEPTAALDPTSGAAVESLISSRIQTGLAVLWVTHDETQAKRIARRRLVVEAGRVCEEADEWPAT